MAIKPKPIKATEAIDVDPPVETKSPAGEAKGPAVCAVCGNLVTGATCEVDGWLAALPVPA